MAEGHAEGDGLLSLWLLEPVEGDARSLQTVVNGSCLEIGDAGARQCGTETEPSTLQWGGVEVVYKEFAVYVEPSPAACAFYLDMIPVVGTQQVAGIRIFFQDGRSVGYAVYAALVTIVTAETGSTVMVATVA